MATIRIPMHTLVLMVGPSMVGKSKLAIQLCTEINRQLEDCAIVVESDRIRRELIGIHFSSQSSRRHDTDMYLASRHAFRILNAKVESLMSYPISKPVIIVDCTAISEKFRKEMRSMADKFHYHSLAIVFHYSPEELLLITECCAPHVRKTVMTQSRRMQKEVWRNIAVREKTILKSRKDAENCHVVVENLEIFRDCQLESRVDWFIIGDVHANMTLLSDLLRKLPRTHFEITAKEPGLILSERDIVMSEKAGLVFVGDLFDKGTELQETLYFFDQFCYHPRVKIIRGNHEARIYRRLLRNDECSADPKFRDHYPAIAENAVFRKQFLTIYDQSVPFVNFCPAPGAGNLNAFVVTHAPCSIQHLRRLSEKSINAQMYYEYRNDPEYSNLANLLQQYASQGPVPYHVFGHVPVKDPRIVDASIGIDTGAEFRGGRMTAIGLTHKDKRIRFYQSRCNNSEDYEEQTLRNIPYMKAELNLLGRPAEVSPFLFSKVKRLLDNGIQFVSGTISPTPAIRNPPQLESLQAGLDWFRKSSHATVVTLEPKYMGSRCQFYVKKTFEDSYMASRNGFKILMDDKYRERFETIHSELVARLNTLFGDFKLVILDGELLPWSYLGQRLIHDFRIYGEAMAEHLKLLKDYGFEDALNRDLEKCKNQEKDLSIFSLSKKEAIRKLGNNHRSYQKFYALKKLQKEYVPVERQMQNLKAYREQLDLYGTPIASAEDIVYKPFDILRVDMKENESQRRLSENVTPNEIFAMINDDPICVVRLNDPDDEAKAHEYFATLSKDMEGVVIRAHDGSSAVPFMKVRNSEYLRIVYGPNFLEGPNYEHLVRRKNIRYKLKESEIEWRLGRKMLECNKSHNRNEFIRVACHFFAEEEQLSSKSDKRL
jgi:predicted kinase